MVFSGMTRIGMSGLLVGLVAISAGQGNPANELIFTSTEAIGLLPPMIACNGAPTQAKWSPDGKMLLICAMEMKITPAVMMDFVLKGGPSGAPPVMPTQSLQMFNVDRQASNVILRRPMQEGAVSDFEWLSGGRSALVVVETPVAAEGKPPASKATVYSLNAASGRLTPLVQGQEDDFVTIDVEDGAKGAVIVTRKYGENVNADTVQTRLSLVTPDGRLGNSIQGTGRTMFGQIVWVNGTRPMMVRVVRPQPNEKAVVQWVDLDFAGAQLRPASDPIRNPDVDPAYAFSIKLGGSISSTDGKNVTSQAAWLVAKEKGPQQSALIAADVDHALLSPGLNAVYYSTKGVGMVRLLMKMPKEAALKALEAAAKAKVMSDAKQVGTAFHIYAADMDDVLPSNASDWMTALSPYLKNNSLMEGFVYTFGGGNIGDIENPASTELGHKQGPGGRAVVYADGHVKWIPDK
jgi:hypothetical protein